MIERPADRPEEGVPPLGSWRRVYALAIAWAIAIWAVLWLLTATFNVPLAR